MTSFSDLPYEIRAMILDAVVISTQADLRAFKLQLSTGPKPLLLSSCAAVCHEWQMFFEPFTFRRLFIDHHEVPKLISLVQGPEPYKKKRLGYIRHLHFHIQYDNDDCDCDYAQENFLSERSEEYATDEDNRGVVSLFNLLAALEAWDGDGDGDQIGSGALSTSLSKELPGMTLELSGSAWGHKDSHELDIFRHYRDYPYETADDFDDRHDAYEYYRQSGRGHPPARLDNMWPRKMQIFETSSTRLLGRYTDTWSRYGTPDLQDFRPGSIRLVRALLVRRRFYQALDRRLLARLCYITSPALEDVRQEAWNVSYLSSVFRHARFLAPRNISLHLETSVSLSCYPFSSLHAVDHLRLFEAICGSENVALSNVVDDIGILEYTNRLVSYRVKGATSQDLAERGFLWPHLTTLALTDSSLLLRYHSNDDQNDDGPSDDGQSEERPYKKRFSTIAAKAICEMPKLKTLEIWCATEDAGCILRFQTFNGFENTPPTITILTTRADLPWWWTEKTLDLWTKTALQFSDLPLRFVHTVIEQQQHTLSGLYYVPYIRVIDSLALRDRVIDPVSFLDMKQDPANMSPDAFSDSSAGSD